MGYPNFGFIELLVPTLAIQHLASLFPDEYRTLVVAMIEARKAAGKTQADLAKTLGRPQSFISKLESGERQLDPAEYVKIMQLLGADPLQSLSALIGGHPKRSKRGQLRKTSG